MITDLPAMAPMINAMPDAEIDRRRRDRGYGRLVVGAVIILSDGSECVVSGFDKQGRPICYPNE